MNLKIFKLDTFTNQTFTGNAAAVCPLEQWIPDELMQNIAAENNLSETAFFVGSNGQYKLRWFTPISEVDLCGHATLASAFVVMQKLEPSVSTVSFHTRSGELKVTRKGTGYEMDFPAQPPKPVEPPSLLLEGLSHAPKLILASADYFLVYETQKEIEKIVPKFEILKNIPLRGIIVTAPGNETDFVSRFFGPKIGINEDPVTGSAHCALAPYWSQQLKKSNLIGKQLSARGGTIECSVSGSRVLLSGECVMYLEGQIIVPVAV
jgi:predicted PhzF superfamily epimerase YddE/YHI9